MQPVTSKVPIINFRPLDHAVFSGGEFKPPTQGTPGAAGYDLLAAVDETLTLGPRGIALVPCGFQIELPFGWEAQIRPRSGLALKHGVTVLNAPGTIDSDYRGEVKVMLINHGEGYFFIHRGDRIAQLVFAQCASVDLRVTDTLSDTDRGAGGFGSTGR